MICVSSMLIVGSCKKAGLVGRCIGANGRSLASDCSYQFSCLQCLPNIVTAQITTLSEKIPLLLAALDKLWQILPTYNSLWVLFSFLLSSRPDWLHVIKSELVPWSISFVLVDRGSCYGLDLYLAAQTDDSVTAKKQRRRYKAWAF